MEKIKVMFNDDSLSTKEGWAEFKNQVSSSVNFIQLDADEVNEQIGKYVGQFYKLLALIGESENYCVKNLKLQLAINKNGEIALAGIVSGSVANTTTIEIEISRKNG